MTNEIQAELRLILHRLESIEKSQNSGFTELATRIGTIEGDLKSNAVWMGKTDQKIETIQKDIEGIEGDMSNQNTGATALAKAAIGVAGSAVGVIGTLVGTGTF